MEVGGDNVDDDDIDETLSVFESLSVQHSLALKGDFAFRLFLIAS